MIITITLVDLHYHRSDFILVYCNVLKSYILNIKSIFCWSLKWYSKFMQSYYNCSFLRNAKFSIKFTSCICITFLLLSIPLEDI